MLFYPLQGLFVGLKHRIKVRPVYELALQTSSPMSAYDPKINSSDKNVHSSHCFVNYLFNIKKKTTVSRTRNKW